ncbi:MAG: helix-turn-helix domain-containing protein [Candidatus Magasanikbacteria bacterium]
MSKSTSLSSLGLEPAAILVYETLISLGKTQVATLIEKTSLSRQGVYDALTILMVNELVDYEKQGRNAWYIPVHPSKLYGLIEEQKQISALKLREAEEGIRLLTASFNLTAHKPGVRYFEGKEGMLEVLEDSLSSPEAIYTFADIEAIVKYIDTENKTYVTQRDVKKIAKKAIIADTPFARNYLKDYHQATTDIRFISGNIKPFGNVMQIYDNKISYLTLTDTVLNGIIVQDPQIYKMHKAFFEYMWNTLNTSKDEPDDSSNPLITNL